MFLDNINVTLWDKENCKTRYEYKYFVNVIQSRLLQSFKTKTF